MGQWLGQKVLGLMAGKGVLLDLNSEYPDHHEVILTWRRVLKQASPGSAQHRAVGNEGRTWALVEFTSVSGQWDLEGSFRFAKPEN